jgi:hypothetical protein
MFMLLQIGCKLELYFFEQFNFPFFKIWINFLGKWLNFFLLLDLRGHKQSKNLSNEGIVGPPLDLLYHSLYNLLE